MTDTYALKPPLLGVTGAGTLALRTAKFGNGYTQDAGDGPNNESQAWPLSWTLGTTDATALMAFIRAHAQGQTFFWTPPLGVVGYWVITDYSISVLVGEDAPGGGVYTITSKWEQRFKP